MAPAFVFARLPIRSHAPLQSARTVADRWAHSMRRRTRSLIALTAAYSITLAAVFGMVSAAQSAALGTSSFCRASSAAGDQAPVAPAQHDLGCCIGCCNGPVALPVSAADISAPALTRIGCPPAPADFFRLPVQGCPSARAPPARV
jgi:hypothetical protein